MNDGQQAASSPWIFGLIGVSGLAAGFLLLTSYRARFWGMHATRGLQRYFASMPRRAKEQALSDSTFSQGLASRGSQFPRTLKALSELAAKSHPSSLDYDEAFATYLSELKASDPDLTPQEWREATMAVHRWLSELKT